ncbi:MAG: hypothetical protein ACSLE4_08420 [Methyloceanibacter sp.]|uniref:hypothetical protein n=1 Tax=Methyloceanibacter sp. TaxID=1965321 RepID=UPI003EE1148C
MSWLMRILVGLGLVLALVIVIVLVIGNIGTREETTQAISMTVGNRTVTVAGHYKDMTQESVADGIKVIVDGHEVLITTDQLSVDGKMETLEPDEDVTVYVTNDGNVQVKVVPQSEGASEEAPS